MDRLIGPGQRTLSGERMSWEQHLGLTPGLQDVLGQWAASRPHGDSVSLFSGPSGLISLAYLTLWDHTSVLYLYIQILNVLALFSPCLVYSSYKIFFEISGSKSVGNASLGFSAQRGHCCRPVLTTRGLCQVLGAGRPPGSVVCTPSACDDY